MALTFTVTVVAVIIVASAILITFKTVFFFIFYLQSHIRRFLKFISLSHTIFIGAEFFFLNDKKLKKYKHLKTRLF